MRAIAGVRSRLAIAAKHIVFATIERTFALQGLLLVLGGVAIILEPQILVWLVAGTSILFGLLLLVAARFIRKFTADLQT